MFLEGLAVPIMRNFVRAFLAEQAPALPTAPADVVALLAVFGSSNCLTMTAAEGVPYLRAVRTYFSELPDLMVGFLRRPHKDSLSFVEEDRAGRRTGIGRWGPIL